MSNPASFVIMEEEINLNSAKKKLYFIFGTLAFFVALTVIVKFFIVYLGRGDGITHEVGVSLPETWYYNRTMMDMPFCQEDEPMLRENVLIGYVDRYCSDVQSCTAVVRAIADEANFFITIGHVFEGYGWRCNVTDVLIVKFIGVIDWSETLIYHVLLKDGTADHEVSPTARVLIDKSSCSNDQCTLLTSMFAHGQ